MASEQLKAGGEALVSRCHRPYIVASRHRPALIVVMRGHVVIIIVGRCMVAVGVGGRDGTILFVVGDHSSCWAGIGYMRW